MFELNISHKLIKVVAWLLSSLNRKRKRERKDQSIQVWRCWSMILALNMQNLDGNFYREKDLQVWKNLSFWLFTIWNIDSIIIIIVSNMKHRASCAGCHQKISKDDVRIKKTAHDTEIGMGKLNMVEKKTKLSTAVSFFFRHEIWRPSNLASCRMFCSVANRIRVVWLGRKTSWFQKFVEGRAYSHFFKLSNLLNINFFPKDDKEMTKKHIP